ncbi:MAG: TSUP family transporter, partial [Deltaproteobacteria bacterium]|nr:TSUP family transporter [Deltaproteobacteria bacterium]
DAKVVNFASNLAAVALFASRGSVAWGVALPMAAAQFAGGALGAHVAVKGGDGLVRRAVLAVVLALVVKLGVDLYRG